MASSKSLSLRIKTINNKSTQMSGFIFSGPLGPNFELFQKNNKQVCIVNILWLKLFYIPS